MSKTYSPKSLGFVKGSETSEAAARHALPEAKTQCELILAALAKAPLTNEELSDQLHIPVHIISARTGDMKPVGVVVETGEKRAGRSGEMQFVLTVGHPVEKDARKRRRQINSLQRHRRDFNRAMKQLPEREQIKLFIRGLKAAKKKSGHTGK